MEYTDKVIEHFMSPRNVGTMPDCDAEAEYGESKCGDSLTVYIKVRDNVITDISYLVFGCAASVASSSVMSELAKGKTIEEALKLTDHDIVRALGGLPKAKIHCSVLGAQGLKKAINNYLEKKQGGSEQLV